MKANYTLFYFLIFSLILNGQEIVHKKSPNIIFILADDLGWMDVAYNGSTFYETPNLDKLSKKGMVFTKAYTASPVCSPTRGSIMSGKYPSTTGYTGLEGQYGKPSKGKLIDATYLPGLPLEEITLAEALKGHGYQTWHIGKWHLGKEEKYAPENQGFDMGITGFEDGNWKGSRFRENDDKFITDHLTDKAIELIEKRKNAAFFLNLWYYAVHTPIKAKAKDIAYFKAKAKTMGLDTIPAMETGEKYPSKPHFDKNRMTKNIERRTIQSNPVYAAFIYCLDQNIGRIFNRLETLGISENTILVFLSDNGGLSSTEGSPTTNSPLREGKGWMYEGGYRVPSFIIWANHIKPEQAYNQAISSTDFYPTLLDLAKIEKPKQQKLDGVSLASVLIENKTYKRPPIYWHSPHYFNNGSHPFSAILDNGWKYIYNYDTQTSELYHMDRDLSEAQNLITDNPSIADKLKKELTLWLNQVEAKFPTKNPNFKQ